MNLTNQLPVLPLATLVAGLLCRSEDANAAGTMPPPVRVITADWQTIKGPRSEMFRECIGAGRAAEGLRTDWQQQLIRFTTRC